MNRCDGIIYIASFERELERDVDWASIDFRFNPSSVHPLLSFIFDK